MQDLLSINNIVILIGIFIFIVILIPGKPSASAIQNAINDYNTFVFDYNSITNELSMIENEIREKRFSKSDYDEIKGITKVIMTKLNELSICSNAAKQYLEKHNLSFYRKELKSANAKLQEIELLKEKFEILNSKGKTEEEYLYEKMLYEKELEEKYKENVIREKAKLGSTFFSGCHTIEQLEKRYKSLCKVYHPDTQTGEEETFKRIKTEYDKLSSKLRRK